MGNGAPNLVNSTAAGTHRQKIMSISGVAFANFSSARHTADVHRNALPVHSG